MEYAFKFASLPKKSDGLLKDLDASANRLAKKLEKIDVHQLNISDYNKRYFGGLLQNVKAALQLRTYLLTWALKEISLPKEQIVLVDYGGGSGLLSLLAKEYGIGTVIYDDIFETSCKDAFVIAEHLGLSANHYVLGDIDDLIRFAKEKEVSCTSVVSYDVIEHIYDVPQFLSKLPQLSDGEITIVMGSGANMKNPYVNSFLHKKQIELETKDRQPAWGAKDSDALKSYFGIRKEIIENYLHQHNRILEPPIIEEFSKRTRGKIKSDIESDIEKYFQTNELPEPLVHPTNTCDPNTGNWAEHLMDTNDLINDLSAAGFKAKILPGYYGDSKHSLKKIAGRCLNLLITLSGEKGLYFSTFYTLYGVRKNTLKKEVNQKEKMKVTTN